MCDRCVRFNRRNPPRTITNSHAKILAHRALAGQPWPLFNERAANYAVEAWISRLERAQTRRNKHAVEGK